MIPVTITVNIGDDAGGILESTLRHPPGRSRRGRETLNIPPAWLRLPRAGLRVGGSAVVTLVQNNLAAVAESYRRFKVRRMYLFGSAAQGAFRPNSSDLDFLVALDESRPAESTENYFGLAGELERLFGRRVDLVTERSVRNPHFREVVHSTRQLIDEH